MFGSFDALYKLKDIEKMTKVNSSWWLSERWMEQRKMLSVFLVYGSEII